MSINKKIKRATITVTQYDGDTTFVEVTEFALKEGFVVINQEDKMTLLNGSRVFKITVVDEEVAS